MTQTIKAGTTSYTDYIFVQDSTSTVGAGKTGLAFGSVTAYYTRPLAAATSITMATQTVTGAFSSGGWIEVDATHSPGLYRFDVPNAVIAAGVTQATISFTASGAAPVYQKYNLVSYDPNDTVRLGLTSLPNAAFGAAGGFFSILNVTGTAQAGTANTITLASGSNATDNFYRRQRVILTGGTGAGQSAVIQAYIGSTKVAYIGQSWATAPDNTTTYSIVHEGSNIANVVRTNTAQGGTTSTIVLDSSSSSTDGVYIGNSVWITGGTGAGQARDIQSYTGSTRTASIAPNWAIAPDNTSVFIMNPLGIQAATDYATAAGLVTAQNAIISEVQTDTAAVAPSVLNQVIDGSYDLQAVLSLMAAVIMGDATGLTGATITYTGIDGLTPRVQGNYAAGSRTITVLTPST